MVLLHANILFLLFSNYAKQKEMDYSDDDLIWYLYEFIDAIIKLDFE